MVYGFMGNILNVDLTSGKIKATETNREWVRKFLGGSGYAVRHLLNSLGSDIEPLSPENILVFMTGPLTGTRAPCTGRHVVCGKSPLTNIWGESNAGGRFGAFLKFAGFDGIVITGKAKAPVFLSIINGSVKLQAAEHLWGKTTDASQEILQSDLGKVQVACIGPAGENLVRFAGIVNEERIAARCGLGSVMGSKNLKAIAVDGAEEVQIANPDAFTQVTQETSKILRELMKPLTDAGTSTYVDIGMMYYDMPIKYFREVEFDVESLNAAAMKEILVGQKACYSCPIACGRQVSVKEYDIENVAGPEYQTIAGFGTNLLIPDIKSIVLLNHLCNQYGMDTISCGSTIALSAILQEEGKLNDGMRWGDSDKAVELVHCIARREGIGNDLAEGSLRFAKKHNCSQLALHVRGLEMPNHDPRAFSGMATIYTIAARGASHMEGDMYTVDMGVDVPELGITSGDPQENESKGRIAAITQDYRAFFDCMIMCHFALVPVETILKLVNHATGFNLTSHDILKIGTRSVTMKRLFNLRCGLKTQDEILPEAFMKPQPEEVTDNFVPDLDTQLDDYYEYRRWDRQSGEPSSSAINELELDVE